jgi:hypothetical protein
MIAFDLLCEVDEVDVDELCLLDIIDIIYMIDRLIDWLINVTSPKYFVSICVVLAFVFRYAMRDDRNISRISR